MQACILVLVCANINQSVFSFLRQLTTWYCSHSPAADTVWPLLTANCAAIDRYLLLAGPTAANPLQLHAVAGWDREADRHLTVA